MIIRNDNMLLRIAQGDSYGIATEYIKFPRDSETQESALQFKRYIKHPTHSLRPGMYSDDTQMSIAVSEVLLGDSFTKKDFAKAFFDCFKRDQRDGYSRGFQKILEESNSVEELLEKLIPDSDKNGAAMRSVPLGVIKDIDQMLAIAEIQASITHNTFAGIFTSRAVALMSHFALYEKESFHTMYDYCISYLPEFSIFEKPWEGRVVGPDVGIKTAYAVCNLLRTEKSLISILKKVIELGGDTDSVAAIVWGIASARMQNEKLPEFFEGGLENKEYGSAFLKDLGKKLMDKYEFQKESEQK